MVVAHGSILKVPRDRSKQASVGGIDLADSGSSRVLHCGAQRSRLTRRERWTRGKHRWTGGAVNVMMIPRASKQTGLPVRAEPGRLAQRPTGSTSSSASLLATAQHRQISSAAPLLKPIQARWK